MQDFMHPMEAMRAEMSSYEVICLCGTKHIPRRMGASWLHWGSTAGGGGAVMGTQHSTQHFPAAQLGWEQAHL